MYNPLEEGKTARMTEDAERVAPSFEPAWGKVITDRNLFSPLRGVPPPPPPAAFAPKAEEATPKPERPLLILRGIVLNQFGEHVALIEKKGARPMPLRKGDHLDDVLVLEVREKSVELLWNEEKINLSIEKVKTLRR